MRRIEAKRKANYWCEEQFWCKVLELCVHWAIALCSEINWPKEQAPGQYPLPTLVLRAKSRDSTSQVQSRYTIALLPKWYGEEGKIQVFAEEVSTRLGEPGGSIIYFEIASGLA